MTSRSPTNRYQNLFLGNCFSYNNYGHKPINYRDYVRNDYMRNRHGYNAPKDSKAKNFHEGRNYNPFAPLIHYNIECYKCNNFGHKFWDCKSVLKYPSR